MGSADSAAADIKVSFIITKMAEIVVTVLTYFSLPFFFPLMLNKFKKEMGNRDRDLVVVAVVVVVVVVVVVAGGMVPEKWLDGESVANWCQKRPGACRCQPCRLLGNTLPACLDLAGGELKFTLSMPSDRPASVTPCRLR